MHIKNWFSLILLAHIIGSAVTSCGDGSDDPANTPGPGKPAAATYRITSKSRVFGFTTQNRYAYCPSVLELPDGSSHMFFCGNPIANVMTDNIYHLSIAPDASRTNAKSVLLPGEAGSWDSQHTCDPSVIKGRFCYNGTEYTYAMFYLGSPEEHYYNEVGVAFANQADSDTWVKYPLPIVAKGWYGPDDQLLSGGAMSWGTGQPSAVSLDKEGKVLLTYTAGDMSGTRIMVAQADLSDMSDTSAPSVTILCTMPSAGLKNIAGTASDYTCNSDIAIDQESGTVVMVRPVQPHPLSYPAYINSQLELCRISLSDFKNGTGSWESLCRITPDDTGFPRNHNACIARDEYGHINGADNIDIYYTVALEEPEVAPEQGRHAEWTYDIWHASIRKS